jgi:hypothetical protein
MTLTAFYPALIPLFFALILFRIWNIYFRKNPRIPIWSRRVGPLYRVGKLAMAMALLLMVPGVIYFLFVVALPSEAIKDSVRTVFCTIFSVWALLEIFLCCSISEGLLQGSRLGRLRFFAAVFFCIASAVYLFPLIPKSLPYPAEEDCVMLELPVRGTWLARHAGASAVTNGHHRGHPYAIDILKLGPGGRLRRGREEAITDYYSYNEPVYAPAAGRVVEVVDGLEGEHIGNHIIMDIGKGKYLFLVHFRNGGIAVDKGQLVRAGALVGYVGNSGGSSGILHLHMHVQNRASWDPDGKVTYPFRFRRMLRKRLLILKEVQNGYLLRNDRFSAPE